MGELKGCVRLRYERTFALYLRKNNYMLVVIASYRPNLNYCWVNWGNWGQIGGSFWGKPNLDGNLVR